MKWLKIPGLLLAVLAAIWIMGGWQVAFTDNDYYYANILVNVSLSDCSTKGAIANAKVTIHNDPETYAEGYTDSDGNFSVVVGLWIPKGMDEATGASKYIQAKAEKQGYGSSYETGRFAASVPFVGTYLNIWLCMSKKENQPPHASFSAPSSAKVGDTVRFDGSGSSDPDGRIVSYDWTFGDGYTGSGRVVTHRYSRAGRYTVTLRVTDDGGLSDSTSRQITIERENQPPHASFSAPSSAKVGDTVRFDGSGSYDPDGTIVSWSWRFGDGYTGTGKITTHTYRTAGHYTVTLTVRDNKGASDTFSRTINIQAVEVAACPSMKDISLPGNDSSRLPPNCSQVYRLSNVPKGTCIAADLVGQEHAGSMRLREGQPPNVGGGPYSDSSWRSSSDPPSSHKRHIRYATSSPTDRDVYVKVNNKHEDGLNYALNIFKCGGPIDLPFKGTNSLHFNADQRVYMVKNPPPYTTIIVDLTGPQGANFDLYLREGKEPRPVQREYDASSRSPGSNEHIEYNNLNLTDDIYIQVWCSSGTGNFTLEIRKKQPLQASFTYTPRNPKAGEEVTFDASQSKPQESITKYQWDFGDGSAVEGKDKKILRHTYRTGGTYTVTLVITDRDGRHDDYSEDVEVGYGRPKAAFHWNPPNPKAGEEITFDASQSKPQEGITKYQWDFGDGSAVEGKDKKIVKHTYRTGGTYTVTLVVKDSNGQQDAHSEDIEVGYGELQCSFRWRPPNPVAGQEITFDASESKPQERIALYVWDFGDGSLPQSMPGNTGTHTYETGGTYIVTLVIFDRDRNASACSQMVQVQYGRPKAAFHWNPPDPRAGEEITFDASDSTPREGITEYVWDFGDGSKPEEGKVVKHAYRTGGTYTVTLVVKDSNGQQDAHSEEVEVGYGELQCSFHWEPPNPVAGQEVTFDASESKPQERIEWYVWDFYDGSYPKPVKENLIPHTFKTGGTYEVTLVVIDRDSNQAACWQEVKVQYKRPKASFKYYPAPPETISTYNPVVFDASESEPAEEIVSYKWDFGDGNFGEGKIVTHRYKKPGKYTINLVVTDSHDASDATSQEIEVQKTSIAELIQQEMTSFDRVAVDGQEYFIVHLGSYIDPNTLGLSDTGPVMKVYTDTQFNPISDPTIAQKVGVIDVAWEVAQIKPRLEDTKDAIDAALKNWKSIELYYTMKNLLTDAPAIGLATAIHAYFIGGASIPIDLVRGAISIAKSMALNPLWVLGAVVYNNFQIAESEIDAAIEIAERGPIADFEVARSFLQHFYIAQAECFYAQPALSEINRLVSEGMPDYIIELGKKTANELTKGVVGTFEAFVREVKFGVNSKEWQKRYKKYDSEMKTILTGETAAAKYSLELSRVDP